MWGIGLWEIAVIFGGDGLGSDLKPSKINRLFCVMLEEKHKGTPQEILQAQCWTTTTKLMFQ